MVCGQVIRDKYKVDQYMSENHLLIANKIKAFHVPISAPSFRVGVKNLLQTNGLGKYGTVALKVFKRSSKLRYCWANYN